MVHTLKLLIATASKRHRLLIYSFVLLSADHIHHRRVPNNRTVLWFCSGNWSNQCLGVDVNECWLTIMIGSAYGESSILQDKKFAKSIVCGFMFQKDLTKCISNVFLLSGRCVPLRDDATCLMWKVFKKYCWFSVDSIGVVSKMTPKECLNVFVTKKKDFLSGKGVPLSWSDNTRLDSVQLSGACAIDQSADKVDSLLKNLSLTRVLIFHYG